MQSDTTTTPTGHVRATRPDRVIVNSLIVDAHIGVHDFEHGAPQRVRFDVEVDTVADYADHVELTGSYVSYADIVEFIEDRAATGEHIELVETWAEDVAEFALRNALAESVRVTVQKIDIFERAAGVGVSIERHRDHDAHFFDDGVGAGSDADT
jgi:dihydroneopterin aldolase